MRHEGWGNPIHSWGKYQRTGEDAARLLVKTVLKHFIPFHTEGQSEQFSRVTKRPQPWITCLLDSCGPPAWILVPYGSSLIINIFCITQRFLLWVSPLQPVTVHLSCTRASSSSPPPVTQPGPPPTPACLKNRNTRTGLQYLLFLYGQGTVTRGVISPCLDQTTQQLEVNITSLIHHTKIALDHIF